MHIEEIEKFLEKQKAVKNQHVKIDFKKRNSLYGMFLKTDDYAELKSKNLWRIVVEPRIKEYLASKDLNLARIFNGTEITKLGAVALAAQ
jgi:hypothetical protein